MFRDAIARLWSDLSGTPGATEAVRVSGPPDVLPSVFDVTTFASATIGAASLAAAEFLGARNQQPTASVVVDQRAAGAAFLSEALFTPDGWELPAPWDPIAGNYEAADGWIRLHTNYRYHLQAALRVLATADDRTSVAEAVRRWPVDELESTIVDAGGCAAAMHSRQDWLRSPAGSVAQPLVHLDTRPAPAPPFTADAKAPFEGIRVLDLTRVIAGPVATRFLAAYGADVLRIDPRGFQEVPALVPDTAVGKRCAMLDLSTPDDRRVFEGLVRDAHILVSGLRPNALPRLGYDTDALRQLNPGLITAGLDAYGWRGPWQARRGFDSLVQMSCGIAATPTGDRPVPLPAQALDHATGYVLATALGQALRRLLTEGHATDIRCSLIGSANVLMDYPTPDGLRAPDPGWSRGAPVDTQPTDTAWGPARRVPVPHSIDGMTPQWTIDAGPLGRHPPAFATTG